MDIDFSILKCSIVVAVDYLFSRLKRSNVGGLSATLQLTRESSRSQHSLSLGDDHNAQLMSPAAFTSAMAMTSASERCHLSKMF